MTNKYLERANQKEHNLDCATIQLCRAYEESKQNDWDVLVIRDIGFSADVMNLIEAMEMLDIKEFVIADRSTAVTPVMIRYLECGWKVAGTFHGILKTSGFVFGYGGTVDGILMKWGE